MTSETTQNQQTGQPLDGLKVIDMGQVYLGPYCGLLFGFLGAEVIKIEGPTGDPIRFKTRAGENPGAIMLNSNKKSVTLDLQDETDRADFLELVAGADVLIENFRPGTMERLGLGFDDVLSKLNPKLVYGSGKGYAADSECSDAPAMDFPIQAYTGLMAVTGFGDGPPVKSGAAITDFLTGVHLYAGIVSALLEREKSGMGQKVAVAMEDVAHHALASNISSYILSPDNFVERAGNSQGVLEVTPYDIYPAADGSVSIMCLIDRHWVALAGAMGAPHLATDPRYAGNIERTKRRAEVDAIVGTWTKNQTRAQIFATLNKANVPSAPVRQISEIARDPDMVKRGLIVEQPHPVIGSVPVPTSPFQFSRHPRIELRRAPQAGEHTNEVLGRGPASEISE